MERPEIRAKTRTVTGKKVKGLRRQGVIPVHVYGKGVRSQALQIEMGHLRKAMAGGARNVLVSLHVDDGSAVPALIREIQVDPRTDRVLHADFYAVSLTEKIRTQIPLALVGEAPAVRSFGGIVVQSLDLLEVECFPTDLLPQIEVDISTLAQVEESIFVRDLKLPSNWDIITDPELMVIKVAAPAAVEEAAPTAEVVAAAAPEAEKPQAEQDS